MDSVTLWVPMLSEMIPEEIQVQSLTNPMHSVIHFDAASGYIHSMPPPPPPLQSRPPVHKMHTFTRLSGSDSEDDNDNNDISLASFDIGSGALTGDSKLKISRQKANLEAKLSETEPVVGPQALPDSSTQPTKGTMTYHATTSYYIREDGSESSADITTYVEYMTNLPVSRRRDEAIFRWM
jgi:hypothetical protein